MSIRLRLALWYAGLLALLLAAFSLGVYGLMAEHLASMARSGQVVPDIPDTLTRLSLLLLGGTGLSILAASVLGWLFAGGALRPIASITQTARAIALSRGFTRRLEGTKGRDELGRLAETFNEMLASLEEAYRAQQRFVADASHELRAPLTTIQGNLELMERNPEMSAEERAEALAHVRQETHRLARLVADLLTLARADAGLTLHFRLVEVDRLLLEVLAEAQHLAQGQEVQVVALEQVAVLGDTDLLKQLLLILLDNALRYTPPEGVLRLSLRQENGRAALSVADTGIGIPPEDLPHIFRRFYRADKARARDPGGTGLGLAIAQWIVDQHGGDIDVESVVGKGSTFRVWLPIGEEAEKPL